jgi:hypothetical protein
LPLVTAGLRWRLTVWVAGVLLVSVAVIFVVVYRDTGQDLRSQIDRDIAGDASQLSQAVKTAPHQTPAAILSAARHYVNSQPYEANSTLLFVIVRGFGTATNYPELFGGPPDDGETAAQQNIENAMGRSLGREHVGFSTLPAPDVGDLRLFEYPVAIGGVTAVVGAGEPLATVVVAEHGVARSFVLAGAAAPPGRGCCSSRCRRPRAADGCRRRSGRRGARTRRGLRPHA